MSAHTPGPWITEALPADPYIVYAGGTHGNGERRYVCKTANGFFGCDESIANAHLVAAAPELLAALKLAEPYLRAVRAAGFIEHIGNDLATVQAAIAKAEGVKA